MVEDERPPPVSTKTDVAKTATQASSRFGALSGVSRQDSAEIAAVGVSPAPSDGAAATHGGSAKGGDGDSVTISTAGGILPTAMRILSAPFRAFWNSGISCSLAEGLMLAVSGLVVSLVPASVISPTQLTFLRCLLGLVALVVTAVLRAESVILYREARNIPGMIIMGTFCGLWLVLFFQSVQYAALGDATVLTNATVLTAAGAWLLLGEKLTIVQICGVLAVTLGLVLIVQPPLIFGGTAETESTTLGLVLAAMSGVSSASACLAARYLGNSTESTLTLCTWTAALSCLVATPFMFVWGDDLIWPLGPTAWGVGAISGGLFILDVVLYLRGVELLPAGVAAALISSEVPFAYLLGLVFLGQSQSYLSLLGIAIVMASILAVSLGGKEEAAQLDAKIHSPTTNFVATKDPKSAAATPPV